MPTPEPNTAAPSRPRRRWPRRLAIGTVALAGLFAAGYWLDQWQAEREWRNAHHQSHQRSPALHGAQATTAR